MHQDMITDKGIFDSAWCPMLWNDSNNNTDRVKPNKNYDPLQSIHNALMEGQNSEWVIVKEIENGLEALPYGQSFWLHIPFSTGKYLLTAHKVTWMFDDGGTIIIRRNKRYDPRDNDAYQAESYVQILILNYVQDLFQDIDHFEIASKYPNWPDQVLVDPSPRQIDEADEWAQYIQEQKEGKTRLIPQFEKCPFCWWKSCPVRKVEDIDIIKFKTDESRRSGVFD